MFNVYVGYDSKLDDVYNVCRFSILRNSNNVNVIPIKQNLLREQKIYNREMDSEGTTEFTLTRFLGPLMNNYTGWSLFCDCDFLWTVNINEVFELRDDKYSVMVVKHDYQPKNNIKMQGQRQHIYPKKNWSSLMLFNNSKCKILTSELIDTAKTSYLHQFEWVEENNIGSLPTEYNFLVGYNSGSFKALHYTDGGPWYKQYENCDYSELWKKEYELYRQRL
jgi:lipopolysaccharide biosynthesis glycosyltransferase